jgi:hypothetical protein
MAATVTAATSYTTSGDTIRGRSGARLFTTEQRSPVGG